MAMVQNLSPRYYMSARPHNDKCEEINLQIVVWSLYIMYTSLRNLHTASTGFN